MPRTSSRRNALGAAAAGVVVVVLCLLLLRRNPRVFWNDDYQISILPVLADMARAWREGAWPLLSPSCWACGNLAGEYQYGTFSLFINALVVAVWQWPLAFADQAATVSIAHLAVLAAGAFLLARRRRLPAPLALAVALSAALNGWLIAWGATDWFGALAAEAWLPWCWWACEAAMWPRSVEGESALRTRLRFLLPAPFVYLLLAGGFPYTVVMFALVSAWLAARALASGRPRALGPLIAGWLLGLGLAAPAWLSLLTYMAGSGRAQGVGSGNFAWTLPLSALPGMILPNWTTHWPDFAARPNVHAAIELAGALVPAVGLLAALIRRPRALRRAALWDLALLGAVLLLCMLPSPGVFRWSFRWLPLFHLVLALAGARALLLLTNGRRIAAAAWWRRLAGNPGAWAFASVAAAWLGMTLARTGNADAITHPLPRVTLLIAGAWMLLDGVAAGRRAARGWLVPGAVCAFLLATYFHMYTNPGVPIYAFGPGLAEVSPLAADRLYVSFYQEPDMAYGFEDTAPDFGAVLRPGSTPMLAGVHFLNGYSPIMAQGVGRRLEMETHGNIPIYVAQELLAQEAGADGLLARLGVDGVIIATECEPSTGQPPAAEWEAVYSAPEATIYHRRGPPRGDVAAWTSPAPGAPIAYAEARLAGAAASRLGASVEVCVPDGGRSALVAFRRPYFPGYEAWLDGRALPVTSYQGLLPTVELPAGSHGKLILRYRPRAVEWGAAIAALSLAAAAVFAAAAFFARQKGGIKPGRTRP